MWLFNRPDEPLQSNLFLSYSYTDLKDLQAKPYYFNFHMLSTILKHTLFAIPSDIHVHYVVSVKGKTPFTVQKSGFKLV